MALLLWNSVLRLPAALLLFLQADCIMPSGGPLRSVLRRQLNAPNLFHDHVVVLLPPSDAASRQVVETLKLLVIVGEGKCVCDGWGEGIAERRGGGIVGGAAAVAGGAVGTAAEVLAAERGGAAAAGAAGYEGKRQVVVLKWGGTSGEALAAAQEKWGVRPVLFNWFMDSVAAFELQPHDKYNK